MEGRIRRKDARNRRHTLRRLNAMVDATFGVWAMPSEGIEGDEWDA
jgi:hypothetical protein